MGPTGEPGKPLVVDLDGTLLHTDLLVESASRFVLQSPVQVGKLAGWLGGGRARLKQELSQRVSLDVTVLPYRESVVAWLREEHASGRCLVLASASDSAYVDSVAAHLGIFSDVLASDGSANLKSEAKRERLVERYGERGFDYVGNHRDDLAVWSAAATAHVVGSPALVDHARRVAEVGRVFEPTAPHPLKAWFRSLRPHQWVKNALVLVPLFTAQLANDSSAVARALLAVVAFSLVASSVYVLNDLADVENDRHHPDKRGRPFASGQLSLLVGWLTWPLLAAAAFAFSLLLLPWVFSLVLLGYLATTLGYTFWWKNRPVADVLVLGGLYTLRIVAGAAVIRAPLSLWLLSFSMLFFLSLALVKRVSELSRLREEGGERAKGRGYVSGDLELLSSYGVATSVGAVIIFALFIHDPSSIHLYRTPILLWGAIPVLLGWIMRVWLLAHRGQMDEDPIVFAIKDRWSLVAGVIIIGFFVAAKVLVIG